MKNMLCMVSRPPYQSSHDLELLEAAMVGAVFDMNVSVLFRDEGVWSLLADQNADPIGQRTLSKVLSALPTYEVEQLFACEESLRQRHIDPGRLCIPVTLLSRTQQAQMLAEQDAVLGAQS